MVQPRVMCRQHLLGEHVELHMFVGTMRMGNSLDGYIQKGLLQVSAVARRHMELVDEMTRRGYGHQSPLVMPEYEGPDGLVDVEENWRELYRRCDECRDKIWNLYPQSVQRWIDASSGPDRTA